MKNGYQRGEPPSLPAGILAAIVAVWVSVLLSAGAKLTLGLGDTDDALRLAIVRDLISGRAGWYDQHIARLQPPIGMDSHWSRLVDGGLTALDRGFQVFLSPPAAELAMRHVWPLLWLLPVIWAALAMARRLGGPLAMFLAAVLCATDVGIYGQWTPGRIDHHNVQIAMFMIALAGAISGGRRGGLIAGLAAAAGLAVGVEALVFLALIGAGVGMRFALEPEAARRPTRTFAIGLGLGLALLFLVQTPPAHWGLSVCDAAGLNLVGGVGVGCLGILLLTLAPSPAEFWKRLAGLAGVGALAAAVYAVPQPACLGGPLGQVDPRLWPIWLSTVDEIRPLLVPPSAMSSGIRFTFDVILVAGFIATAWLGRDRSTRTFAWGLAASCLLVTSLAALVAWRMGYYAVWIATPLIAAAIADLAGRSKRPMLVPSVLAVAAIATAASASARFWGGAAEREAVAEEDVCATNDALRPLAALPPGLVLAEIDMGPYILANTRHSVLSAPYHRIPQGIIAARAALAAPPGQDEAAVRRLGATYILACPARIAYGGHIGLGANSLQVRLDRGPVPAWLTRVSAPGAPLQVYKVRPAG